MDDRRRATMMRGRATRETRAVGAMVMTLVVACVAMRTREASAQRMATTIAAPQISWLDPPQGHVAGGATVSIYGGGFVNSPQLKVRFVRGTEFTETSATWHSSVMISVVTPARNGVGWTQVTVTNDGNTWSGFPNVYTKGSGTFLAFVYDDSAPGFYNGVRQDINVNGFREAWTVTNGTGPYIGGTKVLVEAVGLAAGSTPGASDVYKGPTTGSGTPNPGFPDPMAAMNSPPVRGTFYPGSNLKCRMTCDIDVNNDGAIATDGTERFVKTVPAVWHSYKMVEFETPSMPVPDGDVSGGIPSTSCQIQVTNDGVTYDQTNVAFTYDDPIPTVTSISTSQSSVWGARGPFDGNTEVIVKGTNFLPSKHLKCKFGGIPASASTPLWMSDDVSHVVGEPGGRARWISSTEIRCITPEFGPASQRRQYPAGSSVSGAVGCCAVISVSLSGDGIGSATVVSGGVGYASAPTLTVSGGGGRGASLTATISSGVVTSVTVVSAGADYTQAPSVVVLATELLSPANDPPNIGEYTMQGKGETELDPEVDHGSWSNGRYDVSSAPYDVVSVSGVPGATGRTLLQFDTGGRYSPEDRGGLLPPLGEAGSDGSIKPAHQDLVQVSNNYEKFGVAVSGSSTPSHVGYRDNTATPKGYWLWSRDVGDVNDCKVSNNPPLNFYDGTTIMGHNLDKGSGWLGSDPASELIGVAGNADLGNPSKSCLYYLYGDIYVSPSGSDETGHGTAARPYATIQKCIDSALTNSREHRTSASGKGLAGGYGYTVNRDRCILKDGTYWGTGNRQLRVNGRVVQVWAENTDKAIVDCEGFPVGKNVYSRREPTRVYSPGSIHTQGVVLKRCGFKVPYRATDR